uniref:Transmembrane protein n=1 Tax=Meloidogyne floridensis TaxID=298350 RepID=A0A915P6C7_9BILA
MSKTSFLTLKLILLICLNQIWSDQVLGKIDKLTEKEVKKLLTIAKKYNSNFNSKFKQNDFQTTPIYEGNNSKQINEEELGFFKSLINSIENKANKSENKKIKKSWKLFNPKFNEIINLMFEITTVINQNNEEEKGKIFIPIYYYGREYSKELLIKLTRNLKNWNNQNLTPEYIKNEFTGIFNSIHNLIKIIKWGKSENNRERMIQKIIKEGKEINYFDENLELIKLNLKEAKKAYNSEDNSRKKRATHNERRLARKLARIILRALFTDETNEKLDIIISYLVGGLIYLLFIAWPIAVRIFKITCNFPDFAWLRNHWPGGPGQNNGGGNNQEINPFNQHLHPQIHPQLHPPVHQPPQQIPWFQPHQQQQQAISYTDNNYTNSQSSSSSIQQLRSFNRQHSVNYPPQLQRYSDNESIDSDGQQDSDDEGSDNGEEHSHSTHYSSQDRKRRSVSLMSQNDKEKEENGGIQENNSDKTQIINFDSKQKFKGKGSRSSTLDGNRNFFDDNTTKNAYFPTSSTKNFEKKNRKKRDILEALREAWENCGEWLGIIFVLINLIAFFGIFVYLCYVL